LYREIVRLLNERMHISRMTLTNWLEKEVEHLCCLAHARAKFKYAFEQGQDERARCFLEWIGQLYAFEEEYKRERLSFEEIRERRMGSPTADVMNRTSTRLHELLKDDTSPTGDLMIKALHYLNAYWKQLFAYRHDGRYTIDNSLAERSIRPLTVERKNSLFFGSHTGAETSAIYHTFIETCKMNGISSLEYFKKLFREILTGRNDYANLLPATIGIK